MSVRAIILVISARSTGTFGTFPRANSRWSKCSAGVWRMVCKWYDLLGNAGHNKVDWSNMDIPLVNHHVDLTVLGRARKEVWLKRLRPALKDKI